MARTIIEKMGVHEGMRAYFMKGPSEILHEISSDKLVVSSAWKGKFDLIFAFSPAGNKCKCQGQGFGRISSRAGILIALPAN